MAINDILSVYRQSLIGERQNRLSELQISMQGLQYESAQKFREEGRQREDLVATLDYATNVVGNTMSTDASNIYSSLYNMSDRKGNRLILIDGDNQLKKPHKSLNNLTEIGFSVQDSKDIYNIVQMYQTAQNNPKITGMARGAEMAAVALAKRFSRDYDEYKRSGYNDEIGKSSFLKAMEKGNVLFEGVDSFRKDLSVDSFLGATQAVDAMSNIEKERMEIAEGDYEINTPIGITGIKEKSVEELSYNDVFQNAENSLIRQTSDEVKPIEVDLSSENFLDDYKLAEQLNLKGIESQKKIILDTLEGLQGDLSDVKLLKKTNSIDSKDAIIKIQEISNLIKNSKKGIDSLNVLQRETEDKQEIFKEEEDKANFQKNLEIAKDISSSMARTLVNKALNRF